MGETTAGERTRAITYCVVPRDLARLHDPLRAHFADDPAVEVVVERRSADRRRAEERRAAEPDSAGTPERRTIHSRSGRRVADRRAPFASVVTPTLPRRARRFADRIVFVERLLPSSQHAEDVDTARLVTRFQAGESEVFGEIYLRFFDSVYSYLLVALENQHEAEDATQQVFLKLLEALPRYEFRGPPFRAWLFVIVRHLALDMHAKFSRLEVVEPDEVSRRLDERPVEDEDMDALRWITDRELVLFVERLPVAQRQVLVLRYMLGLDSREIAQVLDRSPADVRMLQSRALRFLKERLTRIGHASVPKAPPARVRGCVPPANVLRARRFALLP
jgi:RNA polymerase sigma-70 factor (ECF subfamily)